MKATLNLTLKETELIGKNIESKATERERKGILATIKKYVTWDKDAIFKDPNWPHLWDHEK